MIKRQVCVVLAAVLAVSVLVGCSKSGSVNTAPLQSSFSSADPASKSKVDAIADDAKAGNYSDALAKLQSLAAQAKLTPEQKQAVQDVIAQIQKQLSSAAGQAQKDANKAASDLQKSLGK